VGVVRKIYSGATDSHGKALYFGMERGSEYVWTPGFIGADGAPGFNLGGKGSFGSQFVGDLGFFYPVGPTYDIRQFDYDHDPQRLAMTEYIYDAQNPDLRHFRAAGGKLILYHGWDDNEIPPRTTVDYYESATRLLGGEKATKAPLPPRSRRGRCRLDLLPRALGGERSSSRGRDRISPEKPANLQWVTETAFSPRTGAV